MTTFRTKQFLLVLCCILTCWCTYAQKDSLAPRLSDPRSFTWILLPDPQTYNKFGRNQPIFQLMTAWIKDQQQKLIFKWCYALATWWSKTTYSSQTV